MAFLASVVATAKQLELASAKVLEVGELFVDVLPSAMPMPRAPYQMAPFEFRELREQVYELWI